MNFTKKLFTLLIMASTLAFIGCGDDAACDGKQCPDGQLLDAATCDCIVINSLPCDGKTCPEGQVPQEGVCISSCQEGTFPKFGLCLPCAVKNCAECDVKGCLRCKDGFKEYHGYCKFDADGYCTAQIGSKCGGCYYGKFDQNYLCKKTVSQCEWYFKQCYYCWGDNFWRGPCKTNY